MNMMEIELIKLIMVQTVVILIRLSRYRFTTARN